MSDKAYTVIGTNVVIDCGTVEEAIAYERELWANQPYAPATPAPLDGIAAQLARVETELEDCREANKIMREARATPAPLDAERYYSEAEANAILSAARATPAPLPCNHDWQPWLANTSQCSCCGARRDDLATPAPLDIPTIVGLLNSDHGFRIQTITSGEQDCRCWFHVAARKAIEPLPATPAPLDVQTTTTDDDAWLTGKTQTRQVPEWASEGYHHTERPERDATPAPLDVSRLARALRPMCDCIRSDSDAEAWARDIAAAYQADEP